MCPHEIDLTNVAQADWIEDPLAQAFLPTPRSVDEKPRLIFDPDRKLDRLLLQLQRLSSPTEPVLRPIWWREPGQMTPVYGLTNVTPMIFIGAMSARTQETMRQIELARAYNRRILVVCLDRLPIFDCDWIHTELTDVSAEPLEAIGAGVLREYMLNAQPE